MKLFGREVMLLGRPIDWDRIKNAWVLIQMRQGRGSGLLNDIRVEKYLGLAAYLVILIPALPKIILPVIAIIFFIGTYYLGWTDEKKWKLWQVENEKTAQHANPFNQRLERHLIRLQKHFNIDMGEDANFEHTGK